MQFDARQLSSGQGEVPRSDRVAAPMFLSVLLVISVAVNVLLGQKVHSLRNDVYTLQSEGRLQIGTAVPPITGHTIDGTPQTLNYGDATVPTVLYVFTPQCGWCKKNIDNLHALIRNSSSRYRLVGISLTKTDLREYVKDQHLSQLDVYVDLSDSITRIYKLGLTPATIVISPEGKVLKVWPGVYVSAIRQEIEHYFTISLPGCCKEGVTSRE
jgi:peroxiredoxin